MRSTSTLSRPRPRKRRAKTGDYIAVDGSSIRYIEAGRDNPGPVLLMLHGWKAGADLWFPHTVPALAARFHVIALDLPGYGFSDPVHDRKLATYATFTNHFCDALGLDDVYLLGHSMGGQIAVAAAAQRLDRFRKLVLVDSAGLPHKSPRWREPLGMLTDSSTRHWLLYPTALRLGVKSAAGMAVVPVLRQDLVMSHLKSLTMPTLIVWGSRDRIVPLEHGALMARMIPRARLAIIHGAGHMPFYQKPEEFNRLVTNFLLSSGSGEHDSENGSA
jgi:pimeloyl-ACP methyl ester carboxylesterase